MKVAIIGMGTIGSGVLNTIQINQDLIADYIGEPMEVTHIYSRTVRNYHDNDLTGIEHVKDIDALKEVEVDLVIEVMGGMESTYELVKHFLERSIPVVSANKDMLATYVDDLSAVGNANQAQLAYEASSAGGIPIINAIQYHLNANCLTEIMGILNGTTNYILTKMTAEGWSYDKALEEAQAIGFAEADPTNDVKGYDAQRKITLLSRLAYKKKIDVDDVTVQGIDQVNVTDIEIAKANAFTLKLLGHSKLENNQLSIQVAPTLLESSHQLAQVNDGMNAVFVKGNAIGEAMFYGPGAGSMETASAVVSDAMNIARFGFTTNFEAEEDAQIQEKGAAQDLYLRYDSNQSEFLDALGLDYELLKADNAWPVIVKNISSEQLTQLVEKNHPQAQYPVQLSDD